MAFYLIVSGQDYQGDGWVGVGGGQTMVEGGERAWSSEPDTSRHPKHQDKASTPFALWVNLQRVNMATPTRDKTRKIF